MVVGLLFGAETNILHRHYQYATTKTSYQKTLNFSPTEVYSPQVSTQQSLNYQPQLILGSPQATISGVSDITPSYSPLMDIAPATTVIPAIKQTDAPTTQEAPMSAGGGSMTDTLIGVGAIAVAGLIAIMFLKKKRKKK